MKNLIYKIFSGKLWDVCWLIAGIALVALSAYLGFDGLNTVFFTSSIGGVVGMIVVQLFANKHGKAGSAIGVAGACLDTFNYKSFGVLANVLIGIYCGILYIIGFFTLDKEITVTKATGKNLIISIILSIAGVAIILKFGRGFFGEDVAYWIFLLSIPAFLFQIIGQYLMIEGKAFCWIFWILANVANMTIQAYLYLSGTETMALVYFAMTFMYTLNAIKAMVLWYGFGEKVE
ncbi:MAG: nicotinamide mononucleotide transporter family protein [Spirochaetaceae bacterium]|jgi:hypothetical protein|nr:nicotinamide mononucleotide transporter family protein [Spirochaetaceae bacterium]